MSWKPEYQVGDDPKFYDNSLRFATEVEAEDNAKSTFYHWTSAKNWRVVESDEPVNYRWVNHQLEPVA